MRDEQVSREYAKALFEAAIEKNKLDTVVEEFNMVTDALADPDFEDFFSSVKVDSEIKKSVFNKAFLRDISTIIRNFFWIIFDNGRDDLLYAIGNEFTLLVDEYHKLLVAKIVTAIPLSDQLTARIKDKIAALKGREVEVETVVDPSIYGGMLIYADGQVIDASVKSRLNSLREKLVQAR